MNNNFKILGIKIDNFLCLKNVEITPDSKLNIFFGKNRQGKTDVLEAIRFALKGTADEDIINVDADKAQVLIDLGKYKIKRTRTRKSHTLTVETAEGNIKKQPQTFLDVLVGSAFSFDPFEFVRLKDKELKKYLLELFEVKVTPDMFKGILDEETIKLLDFNQDGFTVLKNAENIIYSKRAELNKRANQKKALFEIKMKQCEGFKPGDYKPQALQEAREALKRKEQELSNAELLKEQAQKAQETAAKLEEKRNLIQYELDCIDTSKFNNMEKLEKECFDLERQIEELQKLLIAKKTELKEIKEDMEKHAEFSLALDEIQNTLEQLPTDRKVPDIPAIQAEISKIKEWISEMEQLKELAEIYEEAQEGIKLEYLDLAHDAEELTRTLKVLREDMPKRLSQESQIPIDDLSFDGDKVLINGKALKYLSTAEKVEVALKIVREMNKNVPLKLLCLDRAESLDDETLEEFKKQIQDDEFQYFVTQVQHGNFIPRDVFLVENGEVKREVIA